MALIIPSPLWSFVVSCCKVDLKGNFTKIGLALSEASQSLFTVAAIVFVPGHSSTLYIFVYFLF